MTWRGVTKQAFATAAVVVEAFVFLVDDNVDAADAAALLWLTPVVVVVVAVVAEAVSCRRN